jgi:hypothetical protein
MLGRDDGDGDRLGYGGSCSRVVGSSSREGPHPIMSPGGLTRTPAYLQDGRTDGRPTHPVKGNGKRMDSLQTSLSVFMTLGNW